MPIKPENRHHYKGAAWRRVRASILARAGARCEGSAPYPECRAENGAAHPATGSRVVLTIAHLDQDPTNNDPANLRALCQRCHFATDRPFNQAKAMATREAKGQPVSKYKTLRGVQMKTCPACSAREGRDVFHPLADFGERQVAPGQHIVQSWCAACRSAKEAV